MRKVFIILLICLVKSFSQTIKVNYDYVVDGSGKLIQPYQKKAELISDFRQTIFKVYSEKKQESSVLDKDNNKNRVITSGKDTTYFYKDFKANKLYSTERVFTNYFNVVDSTNIFNWEVLKEPKVKILKYECRKAKTKFRGREFIAYFTDEIPLNDGPAKFNGLPGLILKVEIINSNIIYSYTATSLEKTNENQKINNPFDDLEIIDLNTYVNLLKKKNDEISRYNTNENSTIKIGNGLELFEK